ncbi:MAG: hypothetical protein DVB31_13115 [Verrucomicrobia bacterium]|nr:MAG: hypothetical protein DVB31_13115 [Verrucomicrobiota bacterium]
MNQNPCRTIVGPMRDRVTMESRLILIQDELSELNDMQEIDAHDKRRILQLRADEAAIAEALKAGGAL